MLHEFFSHSHHNEHLHVKFYSRDGIHINTYAYALSYIYIYIFPFAWYSFFSDFAVSSPKAEKHRGRVSTTVELLTI